MTCKLHLLTVYHPLLALTTCECGRMAQTDIQKHLRPKEYLVRELEQETGERK